MPKPLPVERGTRARELIASALRTLEVEAAGLTTLASAIQDSIGREFVSAVEMIASGFEATIATVDLKKLPAEFAGRKFDAQLLTDLPDGVDRCGENGEFHTCVVAGPIFVRRMAVVTGERVERDGYAYCDLVIEKEKTSS